MDGVGLSVGHTIDIMRLKISVGKEFFEAFWLAGVAASL